METRRTDRFWSIPGTKATFTPGEEGQESIESTYVWDVSNQDCSFDIYRKKGLNKGQKGRLKLQRGSEGLDIPDAEVKRIWDKGVAVAFRNMAGTRPYFASPKTGGYSRGPEFDRKKELALHELPELGAEVRQLQGYLMRQFLTCFTICIGLGSLLVLLQQATTSSIAVESLVAIAPALVTVVLWVLAAQTSIQLNRITSYTLRLKQQLERGCFLTNYRGWEDALANLRDCKYLKCYINPRCIECREMKRTAWRLRLKSQPVLFSSIMFISYLVIYVTSVCVTITFLLQDETSISLVFALAAITTALTILLAIGAGILTYLTWFGRLSFLAFFEIWGKILNNCIPFQIRTAGNAQNRD